MSSATAVAVLAVSEEGDGFERRVVDVQELRRNAPEYAEAWTLADRLNDVLKEISRGSTSSAVQALQRDFFNCTLTPLEEVLPIRL